MTDVVSDQGELLVRVWRGADEGTFASYRVPVRPRRTHVRRVATEGTLTVEPLRSLGHG